MAANDALLFREKQTFRVGYAKLAMAMPPAILCVICCRQIFFHHPWAYSPVSSSDLLFLTILTLAVYVRLITVRLITELRSGQLSVAMKGFWQEIRVPVAEIRSAVPIEYKPAEEYGGYGVRSGPRGKAYIACGNRALQLELRDGRRLLIGSQRSQELARRIAEVQRRTLVGFPEPRVSQ
jgi:hypothetical protein